LKDYVVHRMFKASTAHCDLLQFVREARNLSQHPCSHYRHSYSYQHHDRLRPRLHSAPPLMPQQRRPHTLLQKHRLRSLQLQGAHLLSPHISPHGPTLPPPRCPPAPPLPNKSLHRRHGHRRKPRVFPFGRRKARTSGCWRLFYVHLVSHYPRYRAPFSRSISAFFPRVDGMPPHMLIMARHSDATLRF
jgi:hypothetical protein